MKKRLTALVLGSLKPQSAPYYVSDDYQTGLRVRVAPSGSATWNVAYRIKGKSGVKSLSLGPCDASGRRGLSLADARERAAAIMKAARLGRDIIDEEREAARERDGKLTIGDLMARYVRQLKSSTRKGGPLRTAADIERRLSRSLHEFLDISVDELRRGDISRLLDVVAEDRPREAEKRRQAIGAMYRWALAKGYVASDPTAGTEGYGRGSPRDRTLSVSEIANFWKWLDSGAGGMPPDCVVCLRLQLCLGARIGEISGMSIDELHEADGRLLWTLPAARSKNKTDRITPLIGTARKIVEEAIARRTKGPLFRTAMTDRALAATDIGNALNKRELPCSHFTTHDLRRTVVSQMDELGIALDTIAAVIGHQRGTRDTRTLVRHYSRPRLDGRVETVFVAWDRRLLELVREKDFEKVNVPAECAVGTPA